MASSTLSAFTLSSIRAGHAADHSASLASFPVVAATSPVSGQTRFASALAHPYYGSDIVTDKTHPPPVEEASPTHRAAAGVSTGRMKASPSSSAALTATTADTRSRGRAASQSRRPPVHPSTATATTHPGKHTTYETALSSFQKTIIAEAREQRHANAKEKAALLARRAAVRQRYSRTPHAAAAAASSSSSSPQAKTATAVITATAGPPRPAWLGTGSVAHPLSPRASPAAAMAPATPAEALPAPAPPPVASSSSLSSSSSLPPPPPLPRAPLSPSARRRQTPSRTSAGTDRRTTRSSSSPSRASPQPCVAASHAAPEPWQARHPALRACLALVEEVDTHYPLLRRLLTPPRRPVGCGSSAAAADDAAAALGQRPPPPPQACTAAMRATSSLLASSQQSSCAASRTSTSQPEPVQGSDGVNSPRARAEDAASRDDDASAAPWLRGMPRTVQAFFTDRPHQTQPLPLYRWSVADALASACMHGPLVAAPEDFDRARRRAQSAHAQRAERPRWQSFSVGRPDSSVQPVEPVVPVVGTVRDPRLRALLDAYFACSHLAEARSSDVHAHLTEAAEEGRSAQSSTSASLAAATPEDEARREARTLEALLSFTTALSTPPRPLPHARASGTPAAATMETDAATRLHWLDTLDMAPRVA